MALIRNFISPLVQASSRLPTITRKQSIHRWVAPTLKTFKHKEKKQGGKITNPRNTYLEWNLEAELYAFGKRLNEDFDSDLLLQAFTDRSYVIKEEMTQKEIGFDMKLIDNLDLAEAGGKFMKQYIQLYLETVLPRFPDEGIIAVRDHLVSEKVLAHVSSHLGTKDIVLVKDYPVEPAILANTLKAIIGALCKSTGEERAAHFVRDFIITQLQGQDVNTYLHIEDPWTMLTEILQKSGKTVEPRLIGEVGRNTLLACYRVGLYVDKKMISSAYGEDISIAKEMAAREALKKVFGTEDHMNPIDFKVEGIPNAEATRQQITSS